MSCLPKDEFPIIDTKSSGKKITVKAETIFNLINKTKFAISNDSGVSHMLSTNYCPLVKLFGPKDANKFTPKIKNLITISSSEVNSNRVEDIKVSRVIKTIEDMKFINV